MVGCYGDMVSTQLSTQQADGGALIPIDPTLELACADGLTTTDKGPHHDGDTCMGCHGGSIPPTLGLAGTLYSDKAGTAPVAGATIHILDADGKSVELVTALNGNFWTEEPVTLPLTTWASTCPTSTAMPTLANSVDCNSCHVAGSRMSFAP